MAFTDIVYRSKIVFTGSSLGTLDATIPSVTAVAPIAIDCWDNYAVPATLGPYDVEVFLAEWITLSIEVNQLSGVSTSVTIWLGGSDFPSAITPKATFAYDTAGPATLLVSFNCTASTINAGSGKTVGLFGYTDSGVVDVNMIELTYSPKGKG